MRDSDTEQTTHKRQVRIGEWLERLDFGLECKGLVGGKVTGLRARFPTEADPMVLLVVRAQSPNGKYIAFVGAPTLAAAILAWRAKSGTSGLKWRVDVPWGER